MDKRILAEELIKIATILSSFDIDLYEKEVANGETNKDGVPNSLLKKFSDTYKKNYGESTKRKLNDDDYVRWEVSWKEKKISPRFLYTENNVRKDVVSR